VPHKQIACGQSVLPGYQFHLKQQHSTARDTPGWREGGRREVEKGLIEAGSGPGFAAFRCASVSLAGGWRVRHGMFTEPPSHQPSMPETGRDKRDGTPVGSVSLPLTSALPMR
jgi:hypothetical protein